MATSSESTGGAA
ncbi:hypothetical protein LINPERPRIM_LOCUS17235 [Linum perenne]